MRRLLLALRCALICLPAISSGQNNLPRPIQRSTIPKVITFSAAGPAALQNWSCNPPGSAAIDQAVQHDGHASARIERQANSEGKFTTFEQATLLDFIGKEVEVRAFLRTDKVSGHATLFVREAGELGVLGMDNMQGRQLTGTSDWAQYSVSLPVKDQGDVLSFGAALSGAGQAWIADIEVLVDGRPIAEAPDAMSKITSGVKISSLRPQQVENLATLGKVWGFLKYQHPAITGGKRDWDADLLRFLPEVLAATDREAANAAIARWIGSLGKLDPCSRCAELKENNLQLRPPIDWIHDTQRLGTDLSEALQSVYRNRSPDQQFYVSFASQIGNAAFVHESSYRTVRFPDAGYQLLALYRFWNAVEYWSPYRNLVADQWDDVLTRYVPRLALAKSENEYRLESMRMIAELHDSHSNLWGSLESRPPAGDCALPIRLRFIGDMPTIIGFEDNSAGWTSELSIGDEITKIGGVPVRQLVQDWAPYYGASNRAAMLRDMAQSMTRGTCGGVELAVERAAQPITVEAQRIHSAFIKPHANTHDREGEAFQRLSPAVAYLKLSTAQDKESTHYVEQAAGTKGWVLDIRDYPRSFMVFWLGSHLVDTHTPFSRFTSGEAGNPGAFRWGNLIAIDPLLPHYTGKIVILVDEVTQSRAEYTAMAFRASPQAIVIGSQTAGADGDISNITLPGGLRTAISGLGVFYPDDKPTQQTGIVPDVVVRPTAAGIRAGRDEVLEEALRRILGPKASEAEVESLAKIPQATHN